MKMPWLLCAATCLLAACETTTGSTGAAADSNVMQSEVQIIEGTTYTATWQNRASTIVRLAFDSGTPVSDTQAIETAALITGCTPLSGPVEPLLVGGLTSVRIPMNCTAQPVQPTAS